MAKVIFVLVSMVLGSIGFAQEMAAKKTDVPASVVIHEGKIVKIVPAKTEIYIEENGKKYEYYFKDHTQITQDGAPAVFASLKEGMKVRVTADRIGKRLDPKLVEILK